MGNKHRLGPKTGLLCQSGGGGKWTGIDYCAETDAVCRVVGMSIAKWAAWPVAMIGSEDSMGMLHFKLYTLYIVSSLWPLYTGLMMTWNVYKNSCVASTLFVP